MTSDVEQAPPAEAEQPKTRKPRKAAAGANGASKPKVKAQAAPKAKKAASKAAKGKAKAPKKASTVKLDEFGLREGSMKSKAATMYASKKGATLGEVKAKLKSVQLNVLNELQERKFKVKTVKEKGAGPRKVTRYFLTAK